MKNKFPSWIVKKLQRTEGSDRMESLIKELKLNTVCSSAACPNMSECYSEGNAAFLILGNICTRNCSFCAVKHGSPKIPDPEEPQRLAQAIKILALKHAVVTSVTRDDLEDGGAAHFCETVENIKKNSPDTVLEILTPDFKGDSVSINRVLGSSVDIFCHNIETVARLYKGIRPQADYKRSLDVITQAARKASILTKSGFMIGLGEAKKEVLALMRDLRRAGCELLTIGQYLRPTNTQIAVREYIHPDIFDMYKKKALAMGFKGVMSKPFARTSYMPGYLTA